MPNNLGSFFSLLKKPDINTINILQLCVWQQRKYTEKEELSILKEGGLNDLKKTLLKYGLYPGTYYDWRKKYRSMGEGGLLCGTDKECPKEMQGLRKENGMPKGPLNNNFPI